MTQTPNIDETMLHAYVDGELDANTALEVEEWLRKNPEDLARVELWQRQSVALHQTYDSVLEEPVPYNWNALVSENSGNRWSDWGRPALAAGIAFAVGIFTGLSLTSDGEDKSAEGLQIAHNATSAHIVYAAEVRHPVEVPASDAAHLVGWLSKRLGHQLTAPDLTQTGYALIGGRLLAHDSQPAAQFMYEHADGQRLTLYVAANPAQGETAFRITNTDGITSFYWLNGPLGFALSGEIQQDELLPIAHRAYDQLSL